MNRFCPFLADDRRGLAAIEFAIVAPMLLLLLGGITDFGLLMAGKSKLANGVAQGADYAMLQGPSVTNANVKAMVQAGALRSGLTPTVTVVVTGPACYCVAGFPAALVTPSAALSPSFTCTGTCPGQEAAPGAFVVITATYLYPALMPFYSQIANKTVTEAVTVRLK
jgi:Flp pilus assembly protein TadG